MEATNDILQLIREVPIKGAVHNYDPVNFSEIGSDKYGGFGDNGGGGNGGRGGRGGGGGGGEFKSDLHCTQEKDCIDMYYCE